MSEQRKPRKITQPKHVVYIFGKLGCQRCNHFWTVSELNPERKIVPCPVCSEPNDIREAVKRGEQDYVIETSPLHI